MGKERAKSKRVERSRPPAYPQVEFLHELDEAVCRHCQRELGDDIDLELHEIQIIKVGGYANWACKCGNKLKIVRQNGN